jgi:transposase-like protein
MRQQKRKAEITSMRQLANAIKAIMKAKGMPPPPAYCQHKEEERSGTYIDRNKNGDRHYFCQDCKKQVW